MSRTRCDVMSLGYVMNNGSAVDEGERVIPTTYINTALVRATEPRGTKRKSEEVDVLPTVKKQEQEQSLLNVPQYSSWSVNSSSSSERTNDVHLISLPPPMGLASHIPPAATDAEKPLLTMADLEFEYDRSQLRDPRRTPGRMRRPRRGDFNLTELEKQELRSRFFIPVPEKPKGRLSAFQKDALFCKTALLDPLKTFHDLNVCHAKGRSGSPTYDDAGFQLDWEKVNEWKRPKAYSKSRMVNGMQRSLQRTEVAERQMYEIFFVDGKGPNAHRPHMVSGYVKDQVSKDIGVPWHQIGPAELRLWEQRGFQKVRADEWWQEPTKEEYMRLSKMQCGASLRKDL